jgi:secreted protein with Ig-like and vWFA domain
MSDSTRQFHDPVWTAYVLDELPHNEKQALEDRLAHDPAARREIQTLRETVALVFAALQSEPVGELSPEQRQRIRAAAGRQLTSLASMVASRARDSNGHGAAPVGRRATRGAVLLASLAMVAVALVVVSVAPDPNRGTDVAFVDSNAGSAEPTDFVVYETEGRDANGTEHLNLAFNVRGEWNVDRLQRDATTGLHFVDVSASGGQPTQRFYVTPVPSPDVSANGSAADGDSGRTDAYFLARDVSAQTNLFGWAEQGDVNVDADLAAPERRTWAVARGQPVVNEALQTVPTWVNSGNYDTSGGARDKRIGVESEVGQQSATRFAQRQAPGGLGGGGSPYNRGSSAPSADGSVPGPATSPDGPASTLESRQNSADARYRRASLPERELFDFGASEADARPGLDENGRNLLMLKERVRIEQQQDQVAGSELAPVQAQLEAASRAEGLAPVETKPLLPLMTTAAGTTAASPPADPEQLRELQLLIEQTVRLQDAVSDLPAQRPAAAAPLEQAGEFKAYFDFDWTKRSALNNDFASTERQAGLSVAFTKAQAGEEFLRQSAEHYAQIVEREFTSSLDAPVSTFSIDTDTASYSNVRRFLDDGQWPPADSVRIEELVNYFPYAYPEPTDEHPVAVTVEAASCPWQPAHRLVRIALKAQEVEDSRRPPTSLVFLVDVSGSMQDENKLPLAQQSLRMLTEQLTENDRIALVTYSDEARQVLDGTRGDRPETIVAAVNSLSAGGSTNGAGGLTLAYDVARRHFIANGTNRVVLCSDGDFNVGISDDDQLVRLIEEQRQSGVFLSIFGFGTGNLKDGKLEKLADHGNGQYFYIDSLDEARKAFVEQLMGTIYTVAKDVKLQVDFNSLQVASYRLIGYENRDLAEQDFDNDAVDAGELGSGHTVTALYEYVPRTDVVQEGESKRLNEAVNERSVRFGALADGAVEVRRAKGRVTIDGEVYSEQRKTELGTAVESVFGNAAQDRFAVDNRLKVVARPEAEGGRVPFNDTLTVRLRYKRPTSDESTRLDVSLVDTGKQTAPSRDFEWAAAVAAFGLLLRQSQYCELANFDAILETAQAAKDDDPTGRRREFIDLVRQARSLWSNQSGIRQPNPVALPSVDAYQKASVAGKYTDLLDKVAAPDDHARYGVFHDYGRWDGTAYRDRTGLPAGYWVYVYPDWFIWGSQGPLPAAAAPPAAP